MIKKSFLVTESKFQVTKKEIKKKFDHIKTNSALKKYIS